MAVKKKNSKLKVIGSNITLVMTMIVAWYVENQEALTAILSPSNLIIGGLIIGAFNVILAKTGNKATTPKARKSVNKKSTVKSSSEPAKMHHLDSSDSSGGGGGGGGSDD